LPAHDTRIFCVNAHRPTIDFGLYDPAYEHDACGVAFVARLDAVPSHETVRRALTALENLEHRGASGADAESGDGAGILMQIPDTLFRAEVAGELPPAGAYGVGVFFLPVDDARRSALESLVERLVEAEGQRLLAWRDVPVDPSVPGSAATAVAPRIRQAVVAASAELARNQDAFERKLYVIRRLVEREAGADLVVPSLSSRTIVYKGSASSSISAIRASRRRSRSSTRGTRRTPSRAGSSRTPIASSPTTARSTRCAGTSTGCAPGSRSSPRTSSARISRRCCR
jgi:glutamate synthase (NADPH/NADH) large chain/glutamate synthase (ferredoxin)